MTRLHAALWWCLRVALPEAFVGFIAAGALGITSYWLIGAPVWCLVLHRCY